MHFLKKHRYLLLAAFIPVLFLFVLPWSGFDDPTSTVIYDRDGELAGARIAKDGQWRFPTPDSIPEVYKQAVLTFEDQYFYYHPGVNPLAFLRAMLQNIKAGEIVSGGSTIHMQVIRLSRKGKSRTLFEKLMESILAVRLELSYTKEEILSLYAGHAPFGGNVVGIEAASWRYFNRDPFNLSVAEAATLAVLPNAPSLIHPGRNRQVLIVKRNRLLNKMYKKKIIDSLTWQTALIEEIPEQPSELPQHCYHLTERFYSKHQGQAIHSTIDLNLQQRVNTIMETRKEILYANQIRNAAALILDTESGEVLSYYGNIRNPSSTEYGGDVDIITSPRSTGSILKPILYAGMLYRGDLLPNTLINDIPTRYRSYSPKNYNRRYDGVVPANEALFRSLNVPAVRMLDQYGLERFHHDLRELGLKSVKYPAEHYGLSLILGGAETTLWELAGLYSGMARVLNHYNRSNGKYFRSDWHEPVIKYPPNSDKSQSNSALNPEEQGKLGAGAIWLTLEALMEVERPDIAAGWKLFGSSRKVAWKTGTSFGFRDGWAIGSTPEYIVAVWVGNATGEGRPGLTGLNAAAPILFDLLNILPETSWFETPFDDLIKTEVCLKSGYKPGPYCTEKDSIYITPAGIHSRACPFHKLIHLSREGSFRVNSDCYETSEIRHESWFVLPPVQEWYYIRTHPGYVKIPPLLPGCKENQEIEPMQLIYPEPGSVIYVPREISGKKGRVIFEARHREEGKTIFWSIDEKFIGRTSHFHEIAVDPVEGNHTLYLVDDAGNQLKTHFEVIDK